MFKAFAIGVQVGFAFCDEKLSDNENKILAIIYKYPSDTQEQIAKKVNLTRRTVQRLMQQLKEQNRIERIGSKRNGNWQIKKGSSRISVGK